MPSCFRDDRQRPCILEVFQPPTHPPRKMNSLSDQAEGAWAYPSVLLPAALFPSFAPLPPLRVIVLGSLAAFFPPIVQGLFVRSASEGLVLPVNFSRCFIFSSFSPACSSGSLDPSPRSAVFTLPQSTRVFLPLFCFPDLGR